MKRIVLAVAFVLMASGFSWGEIAGLKMMAIKQSLRDQKLNLPPGWSATRKFTEDTLSDDITNMVALIKLCKTEKRPDVFMDELSAQALRAAQVMGAQQAIQASYPGSNINCVSESGTLVAGNMKIIYNGGNIVRTYETNSNGIEYEWGFYDDYRLLNIKLTDGNNSATIRIDVFNPEQSKYINANLPIIFDSSNQLLLDKGINFKNNELIGLLNKFYSESIAPNIDVTILSIIDSIILNPKMRDEFVGYVMKQASATVVQSEEKERKEYERLKLKYESDSKVEPETTKKKRPRKK